MGFLSRLFGSDEPDLSRANRFLDDMERLADNENPLLAMKYLERKRKAFGHAIAPNGPLHERFILILFKIKSRVFADNPDAPRKVLRNWANLPSVLQIPLFGEIVEIEGLLCTIRGNNKDLVWLVPAASSPSQQDAKVMIDYTFHFADDPRLAIQFHQWNGNILIRKSFILDIDQQLNSSTVGDLLVNLMKLAQSSGLHVETI